MGIFNRLHFYKRFNPEADFVAIKTFSTGGVDYLPGMAFDKESMPKHKVKAMFESRKITYVDALYNPAEISAIVEENEDLTVVNLVPEIKKGAFGWLTVEVNGEQIGNKTRDAEEAKRIVDEWLKSSN